MFRCGTYILQYYLRQLQCLCRFLRKVMLYGSSERKNVTHDKSVILVKKSFTSIDSEKNKDII